MAELPFLTQKEVIKHTGDTDENRQNYRPVFVETSSGQKVLFYEKYWKTGLESGGYVTFTEHTFFCNVAAGTGCINGVPVVWSSKSLTLVPNSYLMIYVKTDGTVDFTNDFPISFIKNVIVLAFAEVGNSEIVRVENVEKTGRYIFSRRQVLSGSIWVWDDYEFILNSGEYPKAYYSSITNRIYLTYTKNDSIYTRVFNATDELTWSWIRAITITENVINFRNNPEQYIVFMGGLTGNRSVHSTEAYFPFLSYTYVDHVYALRAETNGSFKSLLRLPFVDFGSNNRDVDNLTLEIYKKIGDDWILESEYPLLSWDLRNTTDLWVINPATSGWKKMLVRFDCFFFRRYGGEERTLRLPYNEEYIPNPVNEGFNENQDITYVDGNTIYTRLIEPFREATQTDQRLYVTFGTGHQSILEKTFEYEALNDFREDAVEDINFGIGQGYLEKTYEYESISTYPEDTVENIGFGAGHRSVYEFSL